MCITELECHLSGLYILAYTMSKVSTIKNQLQRITDMAKFKAMGRRLARQPTGITETLEEMIDQ
jgi:hypothetical protein